MQQRLGDVVVKMLVDGILPERRTEMRLDVRWQGSGDDRSVRQLVAGPAVAHVVRLEPQVLDNEIQIAEEPGAVGQAVEPQRLGLWIVSSRVLQRLAEPGRLPSGVFGFFFSAEADGGPLGSFSGLGPGLRFG